MVHLKSRWNHDIDLRKLRKNPSSQSYLPITNSVKHDSENTAAESWAGEAIRQRIR